MKERGLNIDKIDYLAYRDRGNQGGLVVKGEGIDYYQDYRKYCHPLKSIFNPRRCLFCIDHYGVLSDISFGDINVSPYNQDKIGINSLIVRNSTWSSLLQEAYKSGCIYLKEIEAKVVNESQPSAKMKKGRNMRFVYMMNKFGFVVPKYDTQINKFGKSDILKYLTNRGQQFIGSHKVLWPLIKLIKK
jgi:coenzyme F420 hydrogenase subunit beta